MRLLAATTSADPEVRGLPPFWGVSAEEHVRAGKRSQGSDPEQDLWTRGRAGLRDGAEALAELSTAFLRTAEAVLLPSDAGLVPPYRAPGSILNGKLTPRREFAVVRIELPRVKRLARAQDAKVNDVVMAACAGGLRRYLLERDALPKAPLIASMMIAVARAEGASGGNAFVPGMVSLATHLVDPVERFEIIRSSSRHAKQLIRGLASPAALTLYLGVSVLPFALLHAFGRADRAHVHNLVISNVPGLLQKRYVNGALIESDYPMSLLVPGEAMNITAISRANTLDVAVLVCPDLAPDPQRVGEAIAESLDELERALPGKPLRAKATRRLARPASPRRAAAKSAR